MLFKVNNEVTRQRQLFRFSSVSSVPILIVLLFSDLSFMTNINQSFSDVQEVSQALMNMQNPSCESTMY